MDMALYEKRREQGQRLAQARRARGFQNAKAAATYFGWNYSTYNQHESGIRSLQRSADRYARGLRCSEAWLLTGEGTAPNPAKRARQAMLLDPDGSNDIGQDGLPGAIPEFDLRAGAPYGGGISAEWTFPTSWLRGELRLSPATTDVMAIDGPTMAPDLNDGDRVLIDRSHRDPSQGGIFAIRRGDSAIVKHVELVLGAPGPQRIRCISSNATYQPFELTLDGESAEIIGRVAARISRL